MQLCYNSTTLTKRANKMTTLNEIRRGSKVMVRGGFGNDPATLVTVSEVCEDVKNGRPGIDYIKANGDGRWAYLDQVKQVVEY